MKNKPPQIQFRSWNELRKLLTITAKPEHPVYTHNTCIYFVGNVRPYTWIYAMVALVYTQCILTSTAGIVAVYFRTDVGNVMLAY